MSVGVRSSHEIPVFEVVFVIRSLTNSQQCVRRRDLQHSKGNMDWVKRLLNP